MGGIVASDSCQDIGDCSDECLDVATATLDACCDSLHDSGVFPFSAISQCKSSSQSEPVLDSVLECSLPSSSSSNPFGSSSSLVGITMRMRTQKNNKKMVNRWQVAKTLKAPMRRQRIKMVKASTIVEMFRMAKRLKVAKTLKMKRTLKTARTLKMART